MNRTTTSPDYLKLGEYIIDEFFIVIDRVLVVKSRRTSYVRGKKKTVELTDKENMCADNFKVPDKMKALLMSKVGFENLKLEEVEVPEPNENQILARVDACTICTSTLKLINQGSEHPYLRGWDIEKHPIILGDEGAITAVRIGRNLRGKFRVGEKLAIQPAVEHTPINHRERYRHADSMKKVAIGYTLGGHLAEYLLVKEEVIEANCLVKLPSQEMGYYEISLTEPLSCVVSSQDHHIHFMADPGTGERVPGKGLLKGGVTVIFGAGVLGRFHAELAMSYQPRDIIVFDIDPGKLLWIEKHLGVRGRQEGIDIHCELASKGDLHKTLERLSGQNYADDIIDATGSAKAQETAFSLSGRRSVFNSFGGLKLGQSIIGIDMRRVHYDEIVITGSSGGNWPDTVKALELLHEGKVRVGTQIRLVGGLSHAIEFLRLVKSGKVDGKAIVYPHIKLDEPMRVEDEWTRERETGLLNNVVYRI